MTRPGSKGPTGSSNLHGRRDVYFPGLLCARPSVRIPVTVRTERVLLLIIFNFVISSSCLLSTYSVPKTVSVLQASFNLITTTRLEGWFLPFIGDETETQGGKTVCLRSHT